MFFDGEEDNGMMPDPSTQPMPGDDMADNGTEAPAPEQGSDEAGM